MSDILGDEELRRIAAYRAARGQQTAAGVRRAVAGTGAGAAGIPLQVLDLPNARVGGLTAAQAEQLKQAYAALLGEGQKALGNYVAGREKEVLGAVADNSAKITALLEQVVSSSGSVAGAEASARGDVQAAMTNQLGGAFQEAKKRYLEAVEAGLPAAVVVETNKIVGAYRDRVASNTGGSLLAGKVATGADEIVTQAVQYLRDLTPNDQGLAAERLFQLIPGLRDIPEMGQFHAVAQAAKGNSQALAQASDNMALELTKEMAKRGVSADVTGPMKDFMATLGLTPEVVKGLLDQGAQARATVDALAPLGGADAAAGMKEAVGEDRDRILAEMDRLGDVAANAGRPAPAVAREAIEASPEFAAFREDLARKNPSAAVAPANAVFRQYLRTGAEALQGSRRATAMAGKELRAEGPEAEPPANPPLPPVDASENVLGTLGARTGGPADEDPLRRASRNLAMRYGIT